MPAASVIIPHLNGLHHLDDCLSALRRQTFDDFEIILVDNGSSDGSQAYLQGEFPEVKLLQLDRNQGFTGACNAGYAAAHGQFILLLNNDTEVDAAWLAAIVDAFGRHPNVGIVASKMMLFDRRDHFHTAGDFYRLDGRPGNRGVWQRDRGQYDREELVFSACGGAAGYRRRMLEEIGFLDKRFFFSCEDVDISWRAHLSGWDVLYVPSAIVYHKLKASSGTGPISSYHDGRNTLYVIWKNYPTTLLRRHWRAILRAQLKISAEALRAWRGRAARARLRGQIAGALGLPRMLPQRRKIQSSRRIDDESLTLLMAPVDETP